MLVDEAEIHIRAGNGGHGCVSFRREKYIPKGGPDGGDGGDGGNVYILADPAVETLLDFSGQHHWKAKNGLPGMGWERTGFVLWYKRLEKNNFAWPLSGEEEAVTLSGRELNWLLDGIDVFSMHPHEEVSFETVL